MKLDWLGPLVWLLLLGALLWPLVEERVLRLRRTGALQRLGRARSSTALALIARSETSRILGFPLARRDVVDTPEALLRAIARTSARMPIDLVLHVGPGHHLAAEQIAHALIRHPARVTVFVPHAAFGSGLLIALAADEIVLDPNAVLGPVAPQVGPYPAAAILSSLHDRPLTGIDDQTLILADLARKALTQVQALVAELLAARNPDHEHIPDVAALLTAGNWTPHYPILIEEARRLGLPVSDTLPPEVYALLDLYDTTTTLRPTTAAVPLERL